MLGPSQDLFLGAKPGLLGTWKLILHPNVILRALGSPLVLSRSKESSWVLLFTEQEWLGEGRQVPYLCHVPS